MSQSNFVPKLSLGSTLLLGSLLVTACAAPAGSDTATATQKKTTEATDNLTTGSIVLDWGAFDFVETLRVTSLTESVQGDSWYQFCFENNNPCRRANADVRAIVANNPVGIQGFQLNLTQAAGTVITITGASVTTAELQFNSDTGAAFFAERHTRLLHGTTSCSLTDPNSVGFAVGNAGSEKILTGLYLYDEASTTDNLAFHNAYLKAGHVWYSGLKPTASTADSTYNFGFAPSADAAEADFGVDPFTASASTGTYLTEKFGLDEAYVNSVNSDSDPNNNITRWKNQFVVGFCLSGTKKVGSQAARPLLYGSRVRTYRPTMKTKSP